MPLRPATETDLGFITALQARPDYAALVAFDPEEALRRYIMSPEAALMIWEEDDQPEGFVLICGLGNADRTLELRRLAIATPGQGRGRRCLAELTDHAFGPLNARRLYLDVAADNTRARAAYERAGFVYEGTLRQAWARRTGDYADLALYALLDTDPRPALQSPSGGSTS